MPTFRTVTFLLAVIFIVSTTQRSFAQSWSGTGTAWSNAADWSGPSVVPNSSTATVTFGSQPNLNSYNIVDLTGGPWNVQSVTISTPTDQAYSLENSALDFNSNASLNVDQSYNYISSNINLDGSSMTFGGTAGELAIEGAISGSQTITEVGSSTFFLTKDNTTTLTSGTNFDLEGGVLEIRSDADLGYVPTSLVSDYITLDGGTLEASGLYTTESISSTRGITVGQSGGTILGEAAQGGILSFNGQDQLSGSGSLTFSCPASNDQSMISIGGNNPTLSGNVIVNSVILLANNTTSGSATGTGSVTVNSNATLGGDGRISGNTTVNGNISPGTYAYQVGANVNDPSTTNQANNILTFDQNLTINGAYVWGIGAESPTLGYSQIQITGDDSTLTLGRGAQLILSFDLAPDYPSGAYWNSNHQWTIISVGGTNQIQGEFSNSLLSNTQGYFSLDYTGGDGNDLVLDWNAYAAPEPSAFSLALLAAVLGVPFLLRRRTE